MKVIVNADDLGYSDDVNEAVFEFMDAGLITSATMIANSPCLAAATKQLHKFPHCSFGIHLNISEFQPLSKSNGLAPLLNNQGEMFGNPRLRNYDIGLRAAVFDEWCAQIEHLQSLNIPISHIDSHHHVHTIPALFPVLKRIQRKYGITRARPSLNVPASGHRPPVSHQLKKKLWNSALRYVPAHTQCPDRFTSLEIFLETPQNKRPDKSTIELMVHPGNSAFPNESELIGKRWRAFLDDDRDQKISLINYRDI